MSSSALASQFDSIAFPLAAGAAQAVRRPVTHRPAARSLAAVPAVARPIEASQEAVAHAAAPVALPGTGRQVRQAGQRAAGHVGMAAHQHPLSALGSISSQRHAGTLSFKQKLTDVLLIGVWAAMIPGFMWLGHYAGF